MGKEDKTNKGQSRLDKMRFMQKSKTIHKSDK
jgi:hypothetical protein